MRVRPSHSGLLVGYPGRSTPLAAGGEEVARSSYWLRRLLKGDVVQVELETPAAPPPEPEPEPEAPPPASRHRRKKAGSRRTAEDNPES